MKQALLNQAKAAKEYFDRSTRCLEESHSGHTPAEGMFTVAQQVAHVAQTIDWFLDGVTSSEGFNMDFEAHDTQTRKARSLNEARAQYETSFKRLFDFIEAGSGEYLNEPLPQGPIMGGAPRAAAVGGIVEHTAHHRGALTVYSRTLGLTPVMPYMEPQNA